MKFIGPAKWVDWMSERTASLEVPDTVVGAILNYDRYFKRTVEQLVQAADSANKIYILSAGHIEELKKEPNLRLLLASPRVEFIQSPDQSLIDRLRHSRHPRQSPQSN